MTDTTPSITLPPTAHTYATALLSLAVVLITALISIPNFTTVTVIQFLILAAGAVAAYIVPLLKSGAWRGLVKTGMAILFAIGTAIVPLVGSDWSFHTIGLIVLAGVNALAVQLGVAIRIDAEKAQPVVTAG